MLRFIFPKVERAVGFFLIIFGLFCSITIIGTFIGIPLIIAGSVMLGKSALKIESGKITGFFKKK